MPANRARSTNERAARSAPVLEALVRRVYRLNAWFFRGRYQLLARLLGLDPEGGVASPRGTLLIEIDGLGHGNLLRAIELGYMPHTKRLLESGRFRLYRWRCGLAADTPPIQSGLMYGTSEGVVGFYWWDRKTQQRVVGANPYDMRRVEAEVAERSPGGGLLAGGSSYSNIMSGGARYSVLTIAGSDRHWFRPGQGLLRALAILVLNPGKAIRFAFDCAWELLQEMEDRVYVSAMNRPKILEGAFPLVRVLLNVLAREIVTAGTRVDMLRGVNVIYCCYIGYDVVAHHSGPLSRNSLRVLRGIDGGMRKLFDTRGWTDRKYEIAILSDHGMTPCQSVEEAFDSDFETWVEEWWRQGSQATPAYRARLSRLRQAPRRRPRSGRASVLSAIAGTISRHSSGWARTWGRIGAWTLELGSAGAIKLGERFLEEEPKPGTPRIAVISCGPLSQLWVKEVDNKLDLSEVEALCPGFLEALVEHPAVALVVGRQQDHVEVRSRAGTAYLRARPAGPSTSESGAPPRDVVERIEGENPFAAFEEPDVAARQVAAFASMAACGDVVCLATLFVPTTLAETAPGAAGLTHVYTFEKQLGTHASIGGDQSYPFVMFPARARFEPEPVEVASQMYPVLKRFIAGEDELSRSPAATHDGAERNETRSGYPESGSSAR